MRIRRPKAFWLALAIGFCTSAIFAHPTVNFGITGVGPTGNNLAGVYTDPYTGCVGCTASNAGTTVQIFCDDFTDEVNPPEYWTAFATDLSVFTGGADVSSVYYSSSVTQTPVFSALPSNILTPANNVAWSADAAVGFSQETAYVAAAILAAQSISAGPANAATQNQLSFALWGIFDPTLLDSTTTASVYGSMDSTNLRAAQIDLENALLTASGYASGAAFTEATGINATIYSAVCAPTSAGGTPSGCVSGSLWNPASSGRPQEFITVKMFEPSFASLLVSEFFGVTVLGLVFWRRDRLKSLVRLVSGRP